jgi:hypothetical protein
MYKYYQPNKMDLKDKYGDCVIRALSKVLNCSWIEVFESCIPFEKMYQCPISCMTLDLYKKVYSGFRMEYKGISNKKGSKRPTVESFANEHNFGTYILSVANHQVACVDGVYYDTWDCGDCCLYGYFEKIL